MSIRRVEISVLPPTFPGEVGERGWRLNQPMAKDLANHDYMMKPP